MIVHSRGQGKQVNSRRLPGIRSVLVPLYLVPVLSYGIRVPVRMGLEFFRPNKFSDSRSD
jgi:hypothetical protein